MKGILRESEEGMDWSRVKGRGVYRRLSKEWIKMKRRENVSEYCWWWSISMLVIIAVIVTVRVCIYETDRQTNTQREGERVILRSPKALVIFSFWTTSYFQTTAINHSVPKSHFDKRYGWDIFVFYQVNNQSHFLLLDSTDMICWPVFLSKLPHFSLWKNGMCNSSKCGIFKFLGKQ